MNDLIKKIESLSPEKRLLFEMKLQEKGIDISESIKKISKNNYSSRSSLWEKRSITRYLPPKRGFTC